MTQKSFEVEDLFELHLIEDLDCRPGLDVAACAVTRADRKRDGYQSALWLVPLDGSAPRQLTAGTSRDDYPRWAPDGQRLAFVSDRSGTPQVFVIHRDGGEAMS